ncbi:hypothetical protein [Rhodoferax sp.]|uniref:hypothetical protein n=1 Tax=Rhodoferax sp. TaxID=50421 RepID=UPI002848650E|nr:hypothetical protein [Rhodoferax sp.]MDR3367984.1 hypothetical protein [Rhodoferax sp.]
MSTQNIIFTEIDSPDCEIAVEDLRDLQERGIQSEIRVVLTEHGHLTISAVRCNAGTPQRQWNGVDQAFRLHAKCAEHLERFLSSNGVQTLLQDAYSGHTVKWDGHNHVGVLDDDAQEASHKLHQLFEVYGMRGK